MNRNYVDVTKEWLDNATPNSHEVEEQLFFEYKGKKYFVDGKNVVLDYSEKEREVAEWLRNTFGGEIKMIPRVNSPDGIQTPDYLFRNEKWDLKCIRNAIGDRAVDNLLKKSKGQCCNFIIDFIDNDYLSCRKIKKQIVKLYNTAGREWIDKIILKNKKGVIIVCLRNIFENTNYLE